MAKRSNKKTRPPEISQGNAVDAETIFSGKWSGIPWRTITQALVIAAAALWIYWPALRGGWLWDDDLLVTDNAVVHNPYGLLEIWFQPGNLIDYQPLKVSVVWLQWHLWGNDTLGYHLTNVFLHILGALLVWRLLSKFGLRLAWLGGLIFAIHPVQVESVAWIAELKNTLSLPPFLLAMCSWIDFEARGNRRDYFLALGLFLAAMLCKPTMVTFPVVILLYAWWRRDRIGWNDLKISVPFFVVALALGLVTLWFLHDHAMSDAPVPMGGLFSRLACAGLALSFYFSKCFLPVKLMPIYPQWTVDPPSLWQFLPWPILMAVVVWLWTKRGSWGRHALLGLGFFLLNLALFLGFNEASYMAFTWVMDHVLYLPVIGLIGLIVAALGQIDRQLPASFRPYDIGLVITALAFLAFQSRLYAKVFLNEETLCNYTLQLNPETWLGHNNMGIALLKAEHTPEAMDQFEQALQIEPDFADVHYNLGVALMQTGQVSDAIEQYQQALRIKPDFAQAHNNLGNALEQKGQLSAARDQFEEALRIKPNYADACYNLAAALLQTHRIPEAIALYEEALRIKPDFVEARNKLGLVLQQTGQSSEAMEQFEQALQAKPDFAEAHNNLGFVLLQQGEALKAIPQFEQAVQIKPDFAEAHNNLGNALEQTGQLSAARGQFEQALRIRPDFAEAHNNLGNALEQTGRSSEAIEQLEQALRIEPDYTDAHFNLGCVLQQAGRVSEAMDQFQQVLRLNPNDADARNVLAKLQALQKSAPAKN